MANYYFDIETFGEKNSNPYDYEIISIQYQKIWQQSGKPIEGEPLTILKSWERSEEEILKDFLKKLRIEETWHFIPVGNRLRYEFIVISRRAKEYGLNISLEDFLLHPHIDIHPILLMLNKGSFKGARLDTFTKKEKTGTDIHDLFKNESYSEIIDYITVETEEFLKLYQWFLKAFPEVYEKSYST